MKAVVYFLHGLLETAHNQFAPQLIAWKDHCTLVPIDLLGHGKCTVNARVPYVCNNVNYVLAIMRKFGPGHVVAASYLGCPIAVGCATAQPSHFCSLVLSGVGVDVPNDVFSEWVKGFDRLAAKNPEITHWYERMHGERWRETLAAYTQDARERYSEIRLTVDLLRSLNTSILLLNGSKKFNERSAAGLAELCGGNVQGCVLEDAGHVPGRDQPAKYNAVVEAFWKEVMRGR